MASRAKPRVGLRRVPIDAVVACVAGLGVGALAAATTYLSYSSAGGDPALPAVAVIPASLLMVAGLYVFLARRRRTRASNWLALGYAAAAVLATLLFTLNEAVRELYAALDTAVW